MNALALLRRSLPVCVAIGLAGCGSPMQTTPSVAPALAQRPDADRKFDLLYVSNLAGNVTVYRYWQHTFLRLLTGFKQPRGECVDATGNVFVTDSRLEKIREYAHGGTTAIGVLKDRGYQPYSCSVDPTTGNLAVANYQAGSRGEGGIAIYPHAEGPPKIYGPIKYLPNPVAVGYDNQGNLLIASLLAYSSYAYASFALLPKGSQSFILVNLPSLTTSIFADVTSVQWDGQYWAIADNDSIFRYAITSSGKSTYEGTVRLSGLGYQQGQFWILHGTAGSQIVGASWGSNAVSYWHYPAGGSAIDSITTFLNEPYGVTVSPRSATDAGR